MLCFPLTWFYSFILVEVCSRDASFVFLYFCFAACFNFLMSSFTILSMACMTRCDFAASLSLNNSPKTVGTICHATPNLSLSQPHCASWPPAESFFQNLSPFNGLVFSFHRSEEHTSELQSLTN